jgi:replicative DNA helicase
LDVVTLAEKMADDGTLDKIGGISYLIEIANNTPSAANILSYARIVADRAMDRKISEAGQRIFELGESDGDVDEKLNSLHSELASLERKDDIGYKGIQDMLKGLIKQMDDKQHGLGKVGLKTWFKALDDRFMGIEETDLWILAARPAMGKTALALNIANNVALHGKEVLIFSLEMSKEQLVMRMLSAASETSYQKLRDADTKNEIVNISNGVKKLMSQKIHIIDIPAIDVNRALAIARKYARSGNLGLVVIDYLQLMTVKSNNRFDEISQISRQLKVMAKTLKAPVIALSQLSRKCEERQDKRPNNSDLRESGQIEQDADIITFIYRDEIYNENTQNKGVAELITTKFRNGEIGKDFLSTELQFCRFKDVSYDFYYREEEQEKKTYSRKSFN